MKSTKHNALARTTRISTKGKRPKSPRYAVLEEIPNRALAEFYGPDSMQHQNVSTILPRGEGALWPGWLRPRISTLETEAGVT
jgi:hypothetical protein